MMLKQLYLDLTDRGAKKKKANFNVVKYLTFSVPNFLGLLVTLSDIWSRYISLSFTFVFFFKITILIGVTIYTGYLITSKIQVVKNVYYRYDQPLRLTCKILYMPYLVISLSNLVDSAPNGIAGRGAISGNIYEYDTNEVSSGEVRLLSIDERLVSKQIEVLDDYGYFYTDLNFWEDAPVYIELTNESCGTKRILLNNNQNNDTVERAWFVKCK